MKIFQIKVLENEGTTPIVEGKDVNIKSVKRNYPPTWK